MTSNEIKSLTKNELVRVYVSHYVAQWGECERAGLEKQATTSSLKALRMNVADIDGIDFRLVSTDGQTKNIAAHCNAPGHS